MEELIESLSLIRASWQDHHSTVVIKILEAIPQKSTYEKDDIYSILDPHFEAGLTAIRLVLDMSKDEFMSALSANLGTGGIGPKGFRKNPEA